MRMWAGTEPPDQIFIKLRNTALTFYRFWNLNRAAAAVFYNVLKDVDIVTNDEHSYIVDKFKIRRGEKLNAENFPKRA